MSWGLRSLELLIRLVGSYVGPDQLKAEGWVTPEMQASRLVNDLIQRLAASPTKDASDALAAFLPTRRYPAGATYSPRRKMPNG